MSSFVGQVIIPLPILGAVIGNTVGTMMYQIGKDKFSRKEEEILKSYANSLLKLDNSIQEEYQKTIELLMKDIKIYMALVEGAFSPDIEYAFKGSIKLAEYIGVPVSNILNSKEKIEAYFEEI